jgi:hypothetical protein
MSDKMPALIAIAAITCGELALALFAHFHGQHTTAMIVGACFGYCFAMLTVLVRI